jgi:hypothetical protein
MSNTLRTYESDTPETCEAVERWQQGKINIFDEMARLERERDQWRECAERLAYAFKDVPHDPFTIGWSNTQECEKALAKFDRLEGEEK